MGFSDRELFESQVCIDLIQLDIRLGAKFISEVHFTLSYISSAYEWTDIRGNLEIISKIGSRSILKRIGPNTEPWGTM